MDIQPFYLSIIDESLLWWRHGRETDLYKQKSIP